MRSLRQSHLLFFLLFVSFGAVAEDPPCERLLEGLPLRLVYVLDDQDEPRESVIATLLEGGISRKNIRAFGNHSDFLSAIVETRPDLVISDLELGDEVGGNTVALSVRMIPGRSGIPWIFVSGAKLDSRDVLRLLQSTGARDFVSKENIGDLVPSVASLFSGTRLSLSEQLVDALRNAKQGGHTLFAAFMRVQGQAKLVVCIERVPLSGPDRALIESVEESFSLIENNHLELKIVDPGEVQGILDELRSRDPSLKVVRI